MRHCNDRPKFAGPDRPLDDGADALGRGNGTDGLEDGSRDKRGGHGLRTVGERQSEGEGGDDCGSQGRASEGMNREGVVEVRMRDESAVARKEPKCDRSSFAGPARLTSATSCQRRRQPLGVFRFVPPFSSLADRCEDEHVELSNVLTRLKDDEIGSTRWYRR